MTELATPRGPLPRFASDYSREKALAICERHGEGQTISEICRADGMPSRATLYRWIAAHPEFAAWIEIARAEYADTIAKDIVEIADAAEGVGKACHLRLRIEARKFRALLLLRRGLGPQSDVALEPAPRTVLINSKWKGANENPPAA